MRCLVVGGTGFLGGAIADAIIAAGHETTLLSRGRTARPACAGVKTIHTDRYEDLRPLEGHAFDWVFDTCAYTPDAVSRLLDTLDGSLERYVLISSISAYGTFTKPGLTEEDLALEANDDHLELARTVPRAGRASAFAYGAAYGPLKRSAELAAQSFLGDRATLLRVGLLVGAGDYTDRLTWWARRIDEARSGRERVPAPSPVERAVQLIDVRDVALFALHCADTALGGVFNVTGRPMPLGDLLETLISVAGSPAELVWVGEQAVLDAGIVPWTDLPLMAPSAPEFKHFLEVSAERAFAASLCCRPIRETLEPLLEWDRGRRGESLKCGLSVEQEASLLR